MYIYKWYSNERARIWQTIAKVVYIIRPNVASTKVIGNTKLDTTSRPTVRWLHRLVYISDGTLKAKTGKSNKTTITEMKQKDKDWQYYYCNIGESNKV